MKKKEKTPGDFIAPELTFKPRYLGASGAGFCQGNV